MKGRENNMIKTKKILALLLAMLLCFSSIAALAQESGSSESNEDNPPLEAEESILTYKIDNDDILKFAAADFESECLSQTGENLSYVYFSLPEAVAGDLRYAYDSSSEAAVNESTKYYKNSSTSSSKLLSDVYFIPRTSFEGDVEITYKGHTSDGKSYEGKIVITVEKSVTIGSLDKITYSAEVGAKVKLSSSDIITSCRNAGFDLSYVKFVLPETSFGILYYNYSPSSSSNTKVKETTKYYKSSSSSTSIDKVTFVPAKNMSDTVNIKYYAYSSDGDEFAGGIRIKFDSVSYDITYETKGEPVFFVPSDFNDMCLSETGSKLSYVKFSSPSKGSLYYDYENELDSKATVKSSNKYYYSKSPRLYLVSYIPASNYSGTISIDYEGFNINGDSFNGSITIKVDTKNIEDASDLKYSMKNNATLKLSSSSLNSLCKSATGDKLDYVRFTDVSSGGLYYNYKSSSSYDEKVSSSNKYYYSSSDGDAISSVSFVPKSNYTGTVTINYTGCSTGGETFKGKIKISVTSSESSSSSSDYDVDDIKYSGTIGTKISFDGDDFNEVCEDEFGDELEFVNFDIPSTSSGKLSHKNGQAIKSSYDCYFEDDDPLLSDISFTPSKSGKITIDYEGKTYDDEWFLGRVVITVASKNEGMSNFKYSKSYSSGIFTDIDENEWYGANKTGVIKSAYKLGLIVGKGEKKFDPLGNMTIAEAITLAARMADIYYNDESEFEEGDTWYEEYVNYAISRKIIGKNTFSNYNKNITREEMAYIFAHILPTDEYYALNNIKSIPDVDEDNDYYDEIMTLYNAGILLGNDDKGTFTPKKHITRAEVSAIIFRLADDAERLESDF